MFNRRPRPRPRAVPQKNPEGAPCVTLPPDQAVFLIGSNLKPKSSFYLNAKERIDAFEEMLDKATKTDPEYVVALASYLAKDLGIRFSPVVMLTNLARRKGISQDIRDMIKFSVNEVFDRPDKVANAFAYMDFHHKKPTSLPPFYKKALKVSLENMGEMTLRKRRMRRREFSLADLIKMLHPHPKTEKMAALYKAVIENSPTVALKKGESVTATLSDAAATREEKQETIQKSLADMGLNEVLRNLRSIDPTKENRKTIMEKVVRSLRIENGIPVVKVCNPFDVLEAALCCGEPSFRTELSDALGKFIQDIDLGFTGKKVAVMIDISGSMRYVGLPLAAKYMALMGPALLKNDLVVTAFDTACHDRTESFFTNMRKYREDPVSAYDYILRTFQAGGGTSLVECTRQVLEKHNQDILIILSDEITWADQRPVAYIGNLNEKIQTLDQHLLRANIPALLINPAMTGQSAVYVSPKVMRVSSLDAKIFYYLNLISDFGRFKKEIVAKFMARYKPTKGQRD